MPSSYLVQTVTAQVDNSGNATAVLKPDVGQYWAPALVRVATGQTPRNNQFNDVVYNVAARATLYHGAVNNLNSTSYIDDTYQGSGDASSIIAGTIVLYGEAITVQWADGIPGDVAILTVYGRSSDNLIELQQQLSPVPGTRFSGGSGNAMVWDYNNFFLPGTPFGAGGTSIINTPPVFDLPGDALAEVIYAEVAIATNATAGSRVVGLIGTSVIDGNTSTVFRVNNGNAQTAGLTRTYAWGQGVPSTIATPTGVIGTSIPGRAILLPGSRITLDFSGGNVSDQWNNFQVTYRQYKTLTKVSYT